MQADDGAETESFVGIAPEGFHHFREAASHFAGIVHFIQIAHDGDFDAATEGFDEVAGKAGAAAAEFVDDADAWLNAGGDALPFNRMVKEAVAVIERDIERGVCLALFAGKQILSSGAEIARPEETRPFGFQAQDSVEGIRG